MLTRIRINRIPSVGIHCAGSSVCSLTHTRDNGLKYFSENKLKQLTGGKYVTLFMSSGKARKYRREHI